MKPEDTQGTGEKNVKHPMEREAERNKELERLAQEEEDNKIYDDPIKNATAELGWVVKQYKEGKIPSSDEIQLKEKRKKEEHKKNPKLLLNMVKDIKKKSGIIGEEDSILVLINKLNLRNVKNAHPTSSNVIVSDSSGAGKDYITDAVCNYLVNNDDLYHPTDVSPKALAYWGEQLEKEDVSLDGKVLYLEDPPPETMQHQMVRVLASGKVEVFTVREQKFLNLILKGKPVMVATSYQASIDIEGERRWDSISLDNSKELTKKIIEASILASSGNISRKNDCLLEEMVKNLERYEVVIPFADELVKHLPEDLLTNKVMRTQIHKLLDYIKSSAVLHQHQRGKDEQGRIKATLFDYEYGKFVFEKLGDAEASMLNARERELFDCLSRKPTRVSEIVEETNLDDDWIYGNCGKWKERGLINIHKIACEDTNGRRIKHLSSNLKKLSSVLPSASKFAFLGISDGVKMQKTESISTFLVFWEIAREINNLRKKEGLTELVCLFSEMQEMPKCNPSNTFLDGSESSEIQPTLFTKPKTISEYLNEYGDVYESDLRLAFPNEDNSISKLLDRGTISKRPNGTLKWRG